MENPDYKMDNDLFKKEIDIIQDIIKRMASNSFLIKGWMITLVVGAITLNKDGVNNIRLSLAIIPLFAFWYLDAFFLRQEKLFRELYKWVVINRPKTKELMFDANVGRFDKEVQGIFRIMVSQTLGVFYGFTFTMVIVYLVILK